MTADFDGSANNTKENTLITFEKEGTYNKTLSANKSKGGSVTHALAIQPITIIKILGPNQPATTERMKLTDILHDSGQVTSSFFTFRDPIPTKTISSLNTIPLESEELTTPLYTLDSTVIVLLRPDQQIRLVLFIDRSKSLNISPQILRQKKLNL